MSDRSAVRTARLLLAILCRDHNPTLQSIATYLHAIHTSPQSAVERLTHTIGAHP